MNKNRGKVEIQGLEYSILSQLFFTNDDDDDDDDDDDNFLPILKLLETKKTWNDLNLSLINAASLIVTKFLSTVVSNVS